MENKTTTMIPLPRLARHWRVRPETARAILAAYGTATIVRRGRRYAAWSDVLKIEGDPPRQASEADLQAPLLTRDDLAARPAEPWGSAVFLRGPRRVPALVRHAGSRPALRAPSGCRSQKGAFLAEL